VETALPHIKKKAPAFSMGKPKQSSKRSDYLRF
jgi:hypothetical protein